jgi:hypothetical protein
LKSRVAGSQPPAVKMLSYISSSTKKECRSFGPEPTAPTFTYRGYWGMLGRLSTAGYSFASFPEAAQLCEAGRRFVLMRHDVDLDLEKALALARLENDYGIAATYFFLLRTEHYNALSAEGSLMIQEILGLGHHLGLHFDCAAYPPDYGVEELASACRREVSLLQTWFDRPVEVVSYHRPGALALSGNPALSAPLPHTYMRLFTEDIHYCSDSRGKWRDGDPTQGAAFRQGRPMQVLVHPIWWNEEPVTPYNNLVRFTARRQDALERSVAANCVVYRRHRVHNGK